MECSEFEENKKRPLYIFFIIYITMLTVSSDVSIQERQWQLLSVHLWAFCTSKIKESFWRVTHP